MTRILIVGGGFAGLNAAKKLGDVSGVEVTLVDRTNHHLFQPLLYQVAVAGLSPAKVAVPIRSLLSKYRISASVLPAPEMPGYNEVGSANSGSRFIL